MTVRSHVQNCPKCGWTPADGGGPWKGPTYTPCVEALMFACPGCGFEVEQRCNDGPEAKP